MCSAVDRRRRALRDRPHHGLGPGDVRLLAAGRPDTLGFLGGAQIDPFANINTTVIGPYDQPKVRLPGAGGAPEIAMNCGRTADHPAPQSPGVLRKSSISSPRRGMAKEATPANGSA